MLCFESFRRFFILIGKPRDYFLFFPFSASVSSLLSKRNPFGGTFLKIVSSSIYGVWWRHNHLSTSSSRLLCATLLCLWCRCVAEAINKCHLIASRIAKTATIAMVVSNLHCSSSIHLYFYWSGIVLVFWPMLVNDQFLKLSMLRVKLIFKFKIV